MHVAVTAFCKSPVTSRIQFGKGLASPSVRRTSSSNYYYGSAVGTTPEYGLAGDAMRQREL
jgi:hypothetical protein